jgi:hypothetical protein
MCWADAARADKARIVLLLIVVAFVPRAGSGAPSTLRVDYYHTGNDKEERFSMDRVVVEPLPWPGNPAKPIDATNR